MSKFWGRFRLQALQQNSVVKYVLYAIGEIVLISVGILIAMEINNRNELSKNEARVEKLLTQIQHDLLVDIAKANQIIDVYARKDSLIDRVLANEVTAEDYNGNIEYYRLITTVATFQIKDESYQNLIRSSDIIPSAYDSLVANLDELYLNNKTGIDEVNEALTDFTTGVLEKWSQTYPWYSQFFQGGPADEALQFFLNDPFYKNDLATYQTYASENLLAMTRHQRVESAVAYRQIADALHQTGKKPEIITDLIVDISDDKMEQMLGTYGVGPTFKIKVFREKGQLFCQATNQSRFAVYPKSDSTLVATIANVKLIFKNDPKSDKVEGFTLVQNGREIYFTKE